MFCLCPTGFLVLTSVFGIHRNATVWENPHVSGAYELQTISAVATVLSKLNSLSYDKVNHTISMRKTTSS